MWLLFLVFACNPERALEDTHAPPVEPDGGAEVTVADVARTPFYEPEPEVVIPTGAAIFRPECFASPMRDEMARPASKGAARPTVSSAAPRAAPPTPAVTPSAAPVGGEGFAAPEVEASAAPDPAPRSEALEAVVADAEVADQPTPSERRVDEGPTLDWGATVYLSNDDSMSLASAQRLLCAVDNGRSFSPAQVRPHELLNYFS
ncbi:MAG: hypothetical protein JRJ84_25420, partial [Deltaproteobacteria bacterium]|nr:hypothetical protein [Deltaproteobacteria bacterium]